MKKIFPVFCFIVIISAFTSSLQADVVKVDAECILFVYFLLPETKGKSLEEVEKMWAKGKEK